ncbi:MAG TPA: hypothetical protein VF057_04365 [Thermoanaerobaculia bacterium]
MKLAELFTLQLERETASTRRLLQNVPLENPDWKPHPKSTTLGYLSMLVATMPGWIAMIVDREYLDLAEGPQPSQPKDLVALFDKSVDSARRALEKTSDEHLMQLWQLRVAGKVVEEKTRYATIGDTFSHFAHHRGQLTVYLRLNEKPIPSIYGPTADEKW